MLIPTEFLPCALMSNCFLVTIVPSVRSSSLLCTLIRVHSQIYIILCRVGSIHVLLFSYHYRKRTELKWKIYMIRALPNRNGSEFQTFYIRARSGTDSAQWDWGIIGESTGVIITTYAGWKNNKVLGTSHAPYLHIDALYHAYCHATSISLYKSITSHFRSIQLLHEVCYTVL